VRIDRSALENARYLEVVDRLCRLERDIEVLAGVVEKFLSGYVVVAQVPVKKEQQPWLPILPPWQIQDLT
jgi:hypothetical protein